MMAIKINIFDCQFAISDPAKRRDKFSINDHSNMIVNGTGT